MSNHDKPIGSETATSIPKCFYKYYMTLFMSAYARHNILARNFPGRGRERSYQQYAKRHAIFKSAGRELSLRSDSTGSHTVCSPCSK